MNHKVGRKLSMLCPVAAAAHSLVPAGEQTGALGLVHLRGKGHVAVPQAADLVPVLPYAGGKARQIGSAQSGRLPAQGCLAT